MIPYEPTEDEVLYEQERLARLAADESHEVTRAVDAEEVSNGHA